MDIISVLSLFGCSLAFHNGFSPVFSVMKEVRNGRMVNTGIFAFFLVKLAFDASTGVLATTIWQYPCFFVAWFVSQWSSLGSATAFYILSNTICFIQMSGMLESSIYLYPPTWYGYCECMMAGLPYYINSLAATFLFTFAFRVIRDFHEVRAHVLGLNLGYGV